MRMMYSILSEVAEILMFAIGAAAMIYAASALL